MQTVSHYDASIIGSSQILSANEGGRIGADRRLTAAERRRVRHIGNGQTVPVTYADRRDIGAPRPAQNRQQAPTMDRGAAAAAAAAAAKEERRRAAIARRQGITAPTLASKDLSKEATKLLAIKKTVTVSPDYVPQKASGFSEQERQQIRVHAEKFLRNLMKEQEIAKYQQETGQYPTGKAMTLILATVHRRMAQ